MHRAPNPCFCVNLRRCAGVLTEHYDKVLANAGLTASQFALMKSLKLLQPCSVTVLADEMGLDRTTLVRTMRPLLERGLMYDLASGKGRNRALALTAEGTALVERGTLIWKQAQAAVKAYMGAEQMDTLMGLLAKLERFEA